MQKDIQHKWFFNHSPEKVWDYLTNPNLIAEWLMENDFRPVVGHPFQLRTKPVPSIDFDGILYCTVLEMIPYKKLSYSWKCGPGNGQITLDSVVVRTLHPKDKGTEIFLVQSGFKEMENFSIYSIMNEGWLKHIQNIVYLINAETHGTTNT